MRSMIGEEQGDVKRLAQVLTECIMQEFNLRNISSQDCYEINEEH